jgi:orotidine-5'-phosphate decarboxylase
MTTDQTRNFREMLKARQEKVKSLVCVGLDPLPEKLPECVRSGVPDESDAVRLQMYRIVDATAQFACMYKPQIAHWEAIGRPGEGIDALNDVIDYTKLHNPDVPVFLDCKRGDIDRTQERYGVAGFDLLGADGMNFSPYMGYSCMAGLAKNHPGKALVGLCYTSNPSAREVQDVIVEYSESKLPYWQFIANCTMQWAERLNVLENAGLVMAAAYENPKGSGRVYSDHLAQCRAIVGNKFWFLIPDIGAQGGFIEETVKSAYVGPGSIAINSSSEICFASSGKDFAEAAAKKAEELRDKINQALAQMGQSL